MPENFTQKPAQDTMNKVNEGMEKAKETTTKSFKEWYDYIEAHPLQSMLFGAVIYFAFKGFIKLK